MPSNDNDILVRAKFDGTNFNSGISKSSSALEKFKKVVDFTTQSDKTNKFVSLFSKAISGMQKTVDTFNIMHISSTLDNLNATIAGSLNNTTSFIERKLESFVSMVQSKISMVYSGLFVEPKSTGFQEYETQINAVQTILANTQSAGKTIDDVMAALNELNTYADQTIYNFTEMTRNIGTFTAAGVDLETSTQAIKGIANLGAISGSTSQQVSTAMYQLSQALAAGRVGLQDWNSVVNAGMGGKIFQDALVKTAEQMGKVVDLSAGFRESISATHGESWLTADVLLATLQEFADANTELGKLGTEAATKVKTITQLWDTVKESAQSGWTQSWTWIVGDFEDARNILTAVSDKVNDLLSIKTNRRNSMLEYWATVRKDSTDTAESVEAVNEEIERVAMEVIRGDWATGQTRFDMLDAAGYDHVAVQNRVNEILGIVTQGSSDINNAVSGGLQTGREMFLEGLSNIGNFFSRLYVTTDSVIQETFSDIILNGDKLVELSRKFRDLTANLKLSEVQWMDLREIITGVVNVFKIAETALKYIITMFKTAFSVIDFTYLKESIYELFNIDPSEGGGLLRFLSNIANKITEFSIAYQNSEKVQEFFVELGKTVGKYGQMVVDFLTDMVYFLDLPTDVKIEAFKDAIEHADERVSNLIHTIKNILNVTLLKTAGIFDMIAEKLGLDTTKIHESVNKLTSDVKSGYEYVKSIVTKKIEDNQLNNGLKHASDEFGKVSDKIKESFEKVTKSKKDADKELQKTNDTTTATQTDIGTDAGEQIAEDLDKSTDKAVEGTKKGILSKISDVIDIVGTLINTALSIMISIQGYGIVKSIKKLVGSISEIADAMAEGVNAITKPLKALSSVLYSLSFSISAAAILGIAVAIGILAIALKTISKIDKTKIEEATQAIMLLFIGLVSSLSVGGTAAKSIKAGYISRLSTNIAMAILILAASLHVVSKLSLEDIAKSLTVIGVLIVYVKMIIASFTKLAKAAGRHVESFRGLGGMLTSLAFSITELIVPMLILSLIPDKLLLKGIKYLAGMVAAITIFIAVVAAVVGLTNKNQADIPKEISKLTGLVWSLAGAINLLITPIAILALIDAKAPEGTLTAATTAVSILLGIVAVILVVITTLMSKIMKNSGNAKKLPKMVNSLTLLLLGFAVSILALTPIMTTLAGLSAIVPVGVIIAVIAIAVLVKAMAKAMATVVTALSNTRKVKVSVLAMLTVAIVALVGGIGSILFAMKPLLKADMAHMAVIFGGMCAVILSLGLMVSLMGKIKKVPVLAFAAIVAVIAGLDVMLGFMRKLDMKKIKQATIITAITAGLLATALVLVGILGKRQTNVNTSTINNNYHQINKAAQIMVGIGAVLAGLGIAFLGIHQTIETIKELSAEDAPDISKGMMNLGNAILKTVPIFAAIIVEVIVAVMGIIKSIDHVKLAGEIFAKFVLIVEAMMALMATGDLIPRFVQFVLQVVIVILYMIAGAIDNIAEAIVIIIIGIVAGVGRALENHSDELANGLIQILRGLASVLYSLVVAIFGETMAKGVLLAIIVGLGLAALGLGTAKALFMAALVAIVYTVVTTLWEKFIDTFEIGAGKALLIAIGIGALIVMGLAAGIGAGPALIVAAIAVLVSILIVKFCEFLGIASPSKVFTGFGVNIIEGLINGIKNMAGKAWDALCGICEEIAEGFRSFFGINSPSKLMAEYGEYIDEGLANGIGDNGDTIVDSMEEVQNGITDSIDPSIGEGAGEDYAQSVANGMLDGQGYVQDASENLNDSINNEDFAMPDVGEVEMPDILGEGEFLFDTTFTEPTGSEEILDSVSDISDQMNENFGENAYDFGNMFGDMQEKMTTTDMFSNFGEKAGIDMTNGFGDMFNLDSIFGDASDSLEEGGEASSFMDKLSNMFSGSGEDASAGFMEGLGPIATDVTSLFSQTGEDSSKGFLNWFSEDEEGNGFTKDIANIFGDAGTDGGTNLLDGLTSSVNDPTNKSDFTKSLQDLFNGATSDLDTSVSVTPVLAMDSQQSVADQIAANVNAGTVDVSADTRIGIESSGLNTQMDEIGRTMTDSVYWSKGSYDIFSKYRNENSEQWRLMKEHNEKVDEKLSSIYDDMGNVIYFDVESIKNAGLANWLNHTMEQMARTERRQRGVSAGYGSNR